jgi:hypothetical protein
MVYQQSVSAIQLSTWFLANGMKLSFGLANASVAHVQISFVSKPSGSVTPFSTHDVSLSYHGFVNTSPLSDVVLVTSDSMK